MTDSGSDTTEITAISSNGPDSVTVSPQTADTTDDIPSSSSAQDGVASPHAIRQLPALPPQQSHQPFKPFAHQAQPQPPVIPSQASGGGYQPFWHKMDLRDIFDPRDYATMAEIFEQSARPLDFKKEARVLKLVGPNEHLLQDEMFLEKVVTHYRDRKRPRRDRRKTANPGQETALGPMSISGGSGGGSMVSSSYPPVVHQTPGTAGFVPIAPASTSPAPSPPHQHQKPQIIQHSIPSNNLQTISIPMDHLERFTSAQQQQQQHQQHQQTQVPPAQLTPTQNATYHPQPQQLPQPVQNNHQPLPQQQQPHAQKPHKPQIMAHHIGINHTIPITNAPISPVAPAASTTQSQSSNPATIAQQRISLLERERQLLYEEVQYLRKLNDDMRKQHQEETKRLWKVNDELRQQNMEEQRYLRSTVDRLLNPNGTMTGGNGGGGGSGGSGYNRQQKRRRTQDYEDEVDVEVDYDNYD